MTEKAVELSRDSLEIINKFSLFPMILYNDWEILFSNEKFNKILSFEQFYKLKEKIKFDIDKIEKHNQEFCITDNEKNNRWYELIYQFVVYNGKFCILAYLVDITVKKETENRIKKLSDLRALMLEVTQKVSQQNDLDKIYQFILNNSLKAIDNACFGSILIKEDEFLKVVSYVGFEKCILDLRIPLKEAFLYKQTNGQMDEIININDLEKFGGSVLINNFLEKEAYIKSTLSAPIYINNVFFGMINIDSIKVNAFSEEDVSSMEFLKPNIEMALTNHFLYKEKVHLAWYDTLTQIYNRGYFEEHFPLILERARRYHEMFCFVVFDINKLKEINDIYGHLAGDQVIKQVAGVLEQNTRKSDLFARFGGDEFVGIYLHSNKSLLSEKLESIIKEMKKNPIELESQQITCTFSFGIAVFPEDGETMEHLFKEADYRMYFYKRQQIN
ncbi:sensor domain-containing diguanylate cyclase [Aminipila terrae]|uniref:Diguanylate cyclase n=1 Tax=Aminipila terrae TaxID=2697030 RepID=A0A6P1MIE1_9FIRM|nr:sensor domain-containing diguanylate cyclase [Aminipila terrae]QHI72963.1 diguanylate cyclase [Aminipila terrae]